MSASGLRPTLDEVRARRREILAIAARHGARNVCIFGSVARGDADDRSDIDLLIDLDADRSVLDLSELILDLEEALQCSVDIVERSALLGRAKAIDRDALPL